MKKHPFILLILYITTTFLSLSASEKTIIAGQEYYLYNVFYNRILGQKTDGSPGISVLNTNSIADSYIFVAESSTIDGYFLLRQKNSGKYLSASTSNTFSVVFLSSSGTSNNYLWKLNSGLDGSISNKQSPTKNLGCDAGKESETYISVFYDKNQNEQSKWQIINAQNGFEQGRKELYLSYLQRTIQKGLNISAQTNYLESLRQKVSNATSVAQEVYNNASLKTLTEIITAKDNLQNALIECISSDANIILSGSNFDMDASFTLALNQVKVTNNGEFSMLVRNSGGKGALIEISPNKISADYQIIAENIPTLDVSNYQFSFEETLVKIYKNDSLIGSSNLFAIPAYTTNGTATEWSLLGASVVDAYIPEVISSSKSIAQGNSVTDKYGKNVRYAVFVQKQNITLANQVDFHVMNETNALKNTIINLTNEKAWLIFDNTLPSEVFDKYLPYIKINGMSALSNYNVRVSVYLNGTVIMPYSANIKPFTAYNGENYSGDISELKLGANELSSTSNTFRSFVLKRGYMATVASGANGSGYSRVYVADHQDILVPLLPQALDKRISSVHIKKWNYVSKKGWCSTTSNSSIATECKKMRATWFYTWSADRASTYDTEFIPIKQHLFWPSNSQIDAQTNSTHVLSFNEPEHSEQHTSDKCSCGGPISTWTACTKTPDFQSSGMRIGSPSPTDASWLTDYITNCNNMAYRCDFVVMHCYWGTNEAPNAASWYSQLKSIYDKTKRPIWITEWNNGASWTTESWPTNYSDKLEKNKNAIKEILNVLDTCRFVERYSIYNWDSYYRAMINTDDGSITPAGAVYRDNKSTFAYNADVQFTPVWWAPSLKTVELKAKISSTTGKVIFTAINTNGDITDKMIIQRKRSDGTFENYFSETNRSVFETSEHTYSFDLNNFNLDNDEFRLYVTTTTGLETYSNLINLGLLVNPKIVTTIKTAVDGWSCQKSATNGFTKSTGDTFFEVWDSSPIGMNFNYFQDVTDLAEGVYELSAACFNSTNGISGAIVNGHVGLYAQADGVEYFSPVIDDGILDLLKRNTISYIVVKNGKLRVGIKNIGEMSARWAGADEFKLRYLGTISEILPEGYDSFKLAKQKESDERYMKLFVWNQDKTQADASQLIINAECTRKDTYGWNANNIDFSTGESYDGLSSNNYWNKWSSTDFSSELYQDFDYLPEGTYTFGSMLRCSVGAKNKLYTIKNMSNDSSIVIFTGTGITPPSGVSFLMGWNKLTTAPMEIKRGESVRVGFKATLKNQWWSSDHFTFLYEPPKISGFNDVNTNGSKLKIVSSSGYIIIISDSPTNVFIYNMSKMIVSKKHISQGETKINLPAGVYFINKQKVLVK